MKRTIFTGLVASLIGTTPMVYAQSASDQLAEYRRMLADGNPSELYEAEGEELWSKPAGPKNASLEKCDLGLGPGVVQGASAQLPRYFKDTDRVQDLESRLMTCMDTLQGIPEADIVKGSFGKGVRKDLEAIVAYVVTQSKGLKINVPATHPKEKEMLALGEKSFIYRAVQWIFPVPLVMRSITNAFACKICPT